MLQIILQSTINYKIYPTISYPSCVQFMGWMKKWINAVSWGFLNAVIQISVICMRSLPGDPGPFGRVLAQQQSFPLCSNSVCECTTDFGKFSKLHVATDLEERLCSKVDVQPEAISNYKNYFVALYVAFYWHLKLLSLLQHDKMIL